jgi:hypothetical protein
MKSSFIYTMIEEFPKNIFTMICTTIFVSIARGVKYIPEKARKNLYIALGTKELPVIRSE